MKYKKLGDALKYGLKSELPNLFTCYCHENGPNLFAALGQLYISGFLSGEILHDANVRIRNYYHKHNVNRVIQKITNEIFADLENSFIFIDFNGLIGCLNNYEIEDWLFDQGIYVVNNSISGMFERDEYLYYIMHDDVPVFSRIRIEEINRDLDLDQAVIAEFIDNGYDIIRIYKFDQINNCVYLGGYNDNIFYIYNFESRTFKIQVGNFLTTNEGIVYFINRDNCLCSLTDGREKILCKINDNEKYTVKRQNFLVEPMNTEWGYFMPFSVDFNGKRWLDNKSLGGRIIMERIKEFVKFSSYGNEEDIEACFLRYENENISVDNMLRVLEKVVLNCQNMEDDETVHSLVQTLLCISELVDPRRDITELMFAVINAEQRLRDNNGGFFSNNGPVQDLEDRLKNVLYDDAESKMLRKLIDDEKYNDIYNFLVGEVEEEGKPANAKIGTFTFSDGDFTCNASEVVDGIPVGNLVIPPNMSSEYDGFVSYDTRRSRFVVTSKKHISEIEREKICRSFNISDTALILFEQ